MKKSFPFIFFVSCLVAIALIFVTYKYIWHQSEPIPEQSLTRLSSATLQLVLEDTDTPFSIYELIETETAEDVSLESYDMILVNERTIKGLKNEANQLLHSGKLIYYSNPKVSNEQLAQELSISKDYISNDNPYEKIATVIYKVEQSIIFADIYQTNAIENSEIPQEISIESGIIAGLQGALKLRAAKININKQAETLDHKYNAQPIVDLKMLNCYVEQTKKLTMTVIHTTHSRGKWIVNGNEQEVWDANGTVFLHPASTYSIGNYTLRMHANIVGHRMLESIAPQSQLIYPANQTYYLSSGDPKIYDWNVTSKSKIKGETTSMNAGNRVTSNNGHGQRGSFTKLIYKYDKTTTWSLEAGNWF